MKKQGRLASRIILIASMIFVVLLGLNAFLMIYTSKQSVQATVGEQTITIAENILNYIDIVKYDEFIKNPAENEVYWELREQLNELREMNGVLYAYTYSVPQPGEGVAFLVDGMPVDDTEGAAALGDISSSTTYEHIEKVLQDGHYYSDLLAGDYGEYISGFIPIKNNAGEVIAFLGVDIDASYVAGITSSITKSILPSMVGVFALLILVALGLLFYYITKSLRPLNKLVTASTLLEEGDFKGANDIVANIKKTANNEITQFTQAFSNMLSTLKVTFKAIREKTNNLETAVHDINDTTVQVNDSNAIITKNIVDISASSEQQKTNNGEIVLAMNEMALGIQRLADSTNEIAESSSSMTTLVESSVADSQKVVVQIQNVEKSVIQTSDHVREMGEKFASIEEMISVITNIADQTNLLALNAAIEAARAGEAGKGFAVVADEVRKLAELSRHSAEDIHQHLQSFLVITERALSEMASSTEDVKGGSAAVALIGDKLQEILQAVEYVNEQIHDDSAVIQQMSASAEQVLASTEQMNTLMTQATAQARNVVGSTDRQVEMIDRLNQVVVRLDETSEEVVREIEKFKL
ncbi:methyl-accepting chemotaxis protein [Lysinibacillus sp. LZ02]|uniref:methyl-accepting chemotaxis protein n=1 Tax=Lysinibacillus sp. LZ02 TaxID=3420668 RepID=UPI003D35F915